VHCTRIYLHVSSISKSWVCSCVKEVAVYNLCSHCILCLPVKPLTTLWLHAWESHTQSLAHTHTHTHTHTLTHTNTELKWYCLQLLRAEAHTVVSTISGCAIPCLFQEVMEEGFHEREERIEVCHTLFSTNALCTIIMMPFMSEIQVWLSCCRPPPGRWLNPLNKLPGGVVRSSSDWSHRWVGLERSSRDVMR